MAITYTIDLSIILTVIAIISTVYLAIWSRYGLKADTSGIKQSLDKRMRDLFRIVRLLIRQRGTIEYELTNIGKVEITLDEIEEEETTYIFEVVNPIFKEGLLFKTMNESEELSDLEEELFGDDEVVISLLIYNSLELTIPSTENELCNRYIAFFIKWLDSEYWTAVEQFKEREKSLLEHLKEQISE